MLTPSQIARVHKLIEQTPEPTASELALFLRTLCAAEREIRRLTAERDGARAERNYLQTLVDIHSPAK